MGLSDEPKAGQILAERWRLEAPLGGGSFGSVWTGIDGEDGSRVAIKLLHPHHAKNPRVLGRFVQEAEIQAQLSHPAVVPVTAWREHPVAFLVMPLVEGDNLHHRLTTRAKAGERIPLRAVAWLVEEMCGALIAAHDKGIVHRDLKPKNVLVNRKGQRPFVKVLDFGVAKVLDGSQLPPTTVGRVLGSVLYLAPEQVAGGGVPTTAVDQFAIASIAFEVLTLRRAWARDDVGRPLPFDVPAGRGDNHQLAILRRIVRGPRPSAQLERPEAGAAVDAVLQRALAADPVARFSDLRDFQRAFREALFEASELGLASAPTSEAGWMDVEVPPALTNDTIRERQRASPSRGELAEESEEATSLHRAKDGGFGHEATVEVLPPKLGAPGTEPPPKKP